MYAQDLVGKVAVVTGANSGIGLEACVKLAARGSTVVMCCRNAEKASNARLDVIKRSRTPNPDSVVVVELDLADLDNVASFRSRYDATPQLQDKPQVDMLILNAGIMALNDRTLTKQGIEAQMGTNVVGHFRFAYELLDKCCKSQACRIVSLSSVAQNLASTAGVNFTDFNREQKYDKWQTYGESKLGNMLFTHKLNRVLEERGLDRVVAVACHPGYSATNLQEDTPFKYTNFLFAQSAERGSEPTVLAATDLSAPRNAYAGPWFFEYVGSAKWGCQVSPKAQNTDLQDKLWAKCIELTGCDPQAKL